MTFELVRIGWPNTAVIAALMALPLIALTAEPGDGARVIQTSAAPAACETAAGCTVTTTVGAGNTVE